MKPDYAQIFLAGGRTLLRPLDPTDFPRLAAWLNDPTVTYYLFYGQRPLTVGQIEEEIQRQAASPANVVFAVADRTSGRTIGFCGLYDIHATARKAELRIHLGDKAAWGLGHGVEGTELLTYYAFDRLNLNRVYLGVTTENERAVKAYERVGYKVEGVLRQDLYRNSRYYDSIRMGLLREEYYPALFENHRARFAPVRPEDVGRKVRRK